MKIKDNTYETKLIPQPNRIAYLDFAKGIRKLFAWI